MSYSVHGNIQLRRTFLEVGQEEGARGKARSRSVPASFADSSGTQVTKEYLSFLEDRLEGFSFQNRAQDRKLMSQQIATLTPLSDQHTRVNLPDAHTDGSTKQVPTKPMSETCTDLSSHSSQELSLWSGATRTCACHATASVDLDHNKDDEAGDHSGVASMYDASPCMSGMCELASDSSAHPAETRHEGLPVARAGQQMFGAEPSHLLPSLGSKGHPELCRSQCHFFAKGSCTNGSACEYCHVPHQRTVHLDSKSRKLLCSLTAPQTLALFLPLLEQRAGATGLMDQITADLESLQRQAADIGLLTDTAKEVTGEKGTRVSDKKIRDLQDAMRRMSLSALLDSAKSLLSPDGFVIPVPGSRCR